MGLAESGDACGEMLRKQGLQTATLRQTFLKLRKG
jgi:hypothetical protein